MGTMAKNEIDFVGIKTPNRGCSCEEHLCCGDILKPDSLVTSNEETALAV